MNCPVCGAAELVHDIRDIEYTDNNEMIIIQAVEGDFCPTCSEVILDKEQSARYMAAIQSFNRDKD